MDREGEVKVRHVIDDIAAWDAYKLAPVLRSTIDLMVRILDGEFRLELFKVIRWQANERIAGVNERMSVVPKVFRVETSVIELDLP